MYKGNAIDDFGTIRIKFTPPLILSTFNSLLQRYLPDLIPSKIKCGIKMKTSNQVRVVDWKAFGLCNTVNMKYPFPEDTDMTEIHGH